MASKKDVASSVSAVDVFWDGWFNSFKVFQSIQDGVEEKSYQAIANQKEWIQATTDQLTKLQEESKKMASAWKTNVNDAISKAPKVPGAQNYSEWADRVEEISDKTQVLFFSPGKTSLELLSKTHDQLEKTIQEAISQQQKNRTKIMTELENYVDQIKQILK